MRSSAFIVLVGLMALCTVSAVQYTPAALADEITKLPGLDFPINFRQFSGYLTVDQAKERNLFYWFVESQNDPAKDPVFLWTNGGPGCSGLIGFFTEHGPFQVKPDGKTLEANNMTWNKLANIMYIEAPAGVGFSYSNDHSDYHVGDWRTADDNYKAILQFLARFPHLNQSDFHLSSESYGGHYAPTLAKAIVDGNKAGKNPQINLKGFAVGNPYTDPEENSIYGAIPTFWGHSLISKPTWDNVNKHCIPKADSQCNYWQNIANAEIGNLDPYGLDFPVCLVQSQRLRMMEFLTPPEQRHLRLKTNFDPCVDNYAANYLNLPEVVSAIHANPKLGYKWNECSNILRYNQSELDVPMQPVYQYLLANAHQLKIFIFSGDNDSICATLGTQHWLYNLGLPVTSPWKAWTARSGQVGGYLVKFKGISLLTVHGAGHEVPHYTPELGFEVLEMYLNNFVF